MANSLKDMVSSVDWSKMMSRSDARNAIIGSALGGLVLGGSSLLGERDPEESKLAPVGDALTGALLGGVAGYAVPKGLAMFRDSGSLAPDNDKLSSNYGRAAGIGAGVGVGATGVGLVKTLRDETQRLGGLAVSKRTDAARDARRLYDEAVRSGASAEIRNALKNRLAMYDATEDGTRRANRILDSLRRRVRSLRGVDAEMAKAELKLLGDLRKKMTRGYTSFADLIQQVGAHGNGMPRSGMLDAILHPRGWLKNWTSARHYHAGNLLGIFPKVGPGVRMGLRAGKYGLLGAGGAMLLHKLLGPSTQPNYKKQ